jgi:hypothetical protein
MSTKPKGLNLSTPEPLPPPREKKDTLSSEQQGVLEAACRWTGNILAEVLGNLGTKMHPEDRARVSAALRSIREVGL